MIIFSHKILPALFALILFHSCSSGTESRFLDYALQAEDGQLYSYENAPNEILTPEQRAVKEQRLSLEYAFIDVSKNGVMKMNIKKRAFLSYGFSEEEFDYLKSLVSYNNKNVLPSNRKLQKEYKKQGIELDEPDYSSTWEKSRNEFMVSHIAPSLSEEDVFIVGYTTIAYEGGEGAKQRDDYYRHLVERNRQGSILMSPTQMRVYFPLGDAVIDNQFLKYEADARGVATIRKGTNLSGTVLFYRRSSEKNNGGPVPIIEVSSILESPRALVFDLGKYQGMN